jgi:Ca-activated chloride channel family protein
MRLSTDDLRRLLAERVIPEPGPEARARALQAALAASGEVRAEREARAKGSARQARHMDTPPAGGPVMRKLAYAVGGLAVCGILAAIIIPNFLQFRMKAAAPRAGTGMGAPAGNVVERSGAPFDGHAAAPMAAAPSVPETAAPPSAPPGEVWKSAAPPAPPRPVEVSTPPPRPQYEGGDRFEKVAPNPVKVAAEEPVSTFSVDVDTASYAFVRRALTSGALPPKDAVRIEEMVNYFDYDYPRPLDRQTPFLPTVGVFPTPWNPRTKLLFVGIRGYDVQPSRRPRANLVLLVDVSGSMNQPDKLPLLKRSFRMLVDELDPDDSVAIVTYAGSAGTALGPTPAGERGRILAALDGLRAGGSTAGSEGIRQAYALAESHFDPEGVNRVILASDGDFNVGIKDPEELKDLVARKRRSGIFLSVLGFGQGNLNDTLMQKLAQNGNGTAAYIDSLSEARKVLVEEVRGTLFTIAKDVKLQVEFNPARVREYRLIGYESRQLRREDFRDDRVDAGEIGSGHRVTALYEITPAGGGTQAVDDLRYGAPRPAEPAGGRSGEYAYLKIRYKLPDADASRLLETPIDGTVEYDTLGSVPGEARFATAVAAFGQILRGDPHVGDFSFDEVIRLAQAARGADEFGYRAEFVNLVRLAKLAREAGGR